MDTSKQVVLIAGGTGFIGRELEHFLSEKYEVRILSRKKNPERANSFYWNPESDELDEKALENVSIIINLCGSGIADQRWTAKRKKELLDSRIIPARFLASQKEKLPQLKQYITASGINCYDVSQTAKFFTENDPYASDFVSGLVEKWEKEADLFAGICKVVKLRIGFVLSSKGGSLQRLEKPVKMGFGSVLGRGNQSIPWISLQDLISLFSFAIEKQLDGTFNSIAGNTTNREITYQIATKNGKRIWLPKVPGFILKLVLGELSILVLEGIKASNQKIKDAGFQFRQEKLEDCI